MFSRTAVFVFVLIAGAWSASTAFTSGFTKEQAVNAGWDCAPDVVIVGHYHCAPPGRPSLQEVLDGADPVTFELSCFSAVSNSKGEHELLGTEQLMRADLFEQGSDDRACRGGGEWVDLRPTIDYFACHHF